MAGAASTFTIEIEVDATNAATRSASIFSALRAGASGLDADINKAERALAGVTGANQQFNQSLSTSRYALYDVSTTLATTGAALLGVAVATSAVAVAWERDFAQVQRTTGVTGAAVGVLREELVTLAQTMPVAFGDLAEIATLGGQLGVAQNRIASFTETVAKFSAVTDLTVTAAATAFGRLDALLPDVQGNYEALGSSIALVGVNSVATESQIVAISTQISSMGAFAGLTADQVVGLSGALASIGGAPELSRGTITRLFTQMSKAITDGGDKLEGFAKIAGVSSNEFASAFGTSRFGPIFQSFIEGLNDTSRSGSNAVATLGELGITSVRDVPLLLRLANAGTLLGDSMSDAATGFSEATELNRQYGIIADTAAAQIQRLVNSVLSLFDALGSANLGNITDTISFLADTFANLADFASNDFVAPFIAFVTAMGAVAGVLSIVAAGLALAGASSIGMAQGIAALVALAPGASARILGVGTAAGIASGSMTAASISAKLLSTALKALAVIGIGLLLPDVGKWAADTVYNLKGLNTTTDESVDRLTRLFKSGEIAPNLNVSGIDEFTAGFKRMFAVFEENDIKTIKEVDEELARLASSGFPQTAAQQYDQLRDAFIETGGSAKAFKALFIDSTAALEGSRNAVDATNGTFATLEEGLAAVEAEARETEDALNALRDSILNFGEVSINAEQAQINLQRALNDLATAGANADATLGGTNQASLDLSQSFIDTNKAALDAAAAVAQNTGDMDAATAAYLAGREAIVQARIAKGEDADAARAWADTIFGSSAEAQAAVQAYINKVNSTPENKTTRFYVDASGAYRAVDSLVSYINSRTATMTITQRVVYESSVLSGGRGRLVPGAATGGYIQGPGTATSDSILTRLSNGEYVMRAAAVDKYGTSFMNAINSMKVPKFASGGQVGGGSSAPVMGSVVELGPKSLARLSQSVTNNILLDDIAISRSSQRGDAKRRSIGDL